MGTTLQLFTASSGKLSARVLFDNGITRHLHSTVNPDAEAALYDSLEWYGTVVVFLGVGFGYHLSHAIKKLPIAAVCIVVDYYDECLQFVKKNIFAGIPNRICYVNVNDPELVFFARSLPQGVLQIVRHPASVACHPDAYKKAADILSAAIVPVQPGISIPAKNVMLFYGNFFLEEEIRRALLACGMFPVLYNYNDRKTALETESAFACLAQKGKPDFVLTVNMKGFDTDAEIGSIARRLGIPVIVWFVDDPRPVLIATQKQVSGNMRAFCWEKSYVPFLENAGFDKVEHLPLACDPSLFAVDTAAKTTLLGFVGTSMLDKYAGNIRAKFLWSDTLDPLVEKAAAEILVHPDFDVHANLTQLAAMSNTVIPFTDERNRLWLATYCIHHASMKKRQRMVTALLPQHIEVFGDPAGWRELVGLPLITHDNVDYRKDLASTYSKICVNVNSTSCQMPSAVNQRVFDIPMSNSFVLSDMQKDLFDLFDKEEIACYENIDDLQDKVRYYLSHETERDRITSRAQKKILARHTYKHRVDKIFESLKK